MDLLLAGGKYSYTLWDNAHIIEKETILDPNWNVIRKL